MFFKLKSFVVFFKFILLDGKVLLLQVTFAVSDIQSMTKIFSLNVLSLQSH